MNSSAQGTTEYLVLIGLVIVIALVVVGVLGGIPEAVGGISEAQSKAYWSTAAPLALKEWKISDEATDAVFVFQNLGTKTLTITEVTVDGTDIVVEPDVQITAGSEKAVTGTTGIASTSSTYDFDVIITYNSGSITGLKFVGEKPIAGKIAGSSAPSCSCGSWSDSACNGNGCSATQMYQTRSCTPSACDIESQCIDDSCSSWADNSCGGGSCTSTQMNQTRTCALGCGIESRCINDSCTAWVNGSCGGGSCTSTQMQQIRACILGCGITQQCLNDSCGAWADYCVDEELWHNRTCTYDCLATNELVDVCDDDCCNQYCISISRPGGSCNRNRCRCLFVVP